MFGPFRRYLRDSKPFHRQAGGGPKVQRIQRQHESEGSFSTRIIFTRKITVRRRGDGSESFRDNILMEQFHPNPSPVGASCSFVSKLCGNHPKRQQVERGFEIERPAREAPLLCWESPMFDLMICEREFLEQRFPVRRFIHRDGQRGTGGT